MRRVETSEAFPYGVTGGVIGSVRTLAGRGAKRIEPAANYQVEPLARDSDSSSFGPPVRKSQWVDFIMCLHLPFVNPSMHAFFERVRHGWDVEGPKA